MTSTRERPPGQPGAPVGSDLTDPRDERLLAPRFRAATIGTFALVSLGAFEALALTTVMPRIAADLHGESLYAMAFTATLAAGIVSIVLAGNLADRSGPRRPLAIGLALFAAGLIGAALAPSMVPLVGARVLQGLGAGMTTTALYVLVARAYPARLHTAVFAGFAAAWVLPSIFGPFLAGLIAQTLGWRWVFGVSLIVLVIAAVLLQRVLATIAAAPTQVPWRVASLAASVVLAVAVLGLNAVGEHPEGWLLLAGAVAVVALLAGFRKLTPPGTLLAGRGLPADVTLRTLGTAAFAGAEIYIPRLLTERDGYPPTLAGLALSITGVTWFAASWVQGRWSERIDAVRSAQVALLLMTVALGGIALSVALDAPAAVIIAIWPVVGFGMGTLYPRLTAQALSRAERDQQGFVSSALQIGDSTGGATALAVSAIVFAAVGGAAGWTAFVAVFGVMAVPAAIGMLVAHRIR
ncbi:MFS transporter [Nakamurella lactea]|uniref:MFS transporter n=1 Tax=Nakamurella lactea TaxID=459515 RepID=UPI00040D2453|nr:MFS transporter [Nakamurella lactea]